MIYIGLDPKPKTLNPSAIRNSLHLFSPIKNERKKETPSLHFRLLENTSSEQEIISVNVLDREKKMEKSIITLDKGTTCTAWNYSGQRLATGSIDGTLTIFDALEPASSSFTCSSRFKVRISLLFFSYLFLFVRKLSCNFTL